MDKKMRLIVGFLIGIIVFYLIFKYIKPQRVALGLVVSIMALLIAIVASKRNKNKNLNGSDKNNIENIDK